MLVNWILYPLVLVVAAAGHGLLVRRAVGVPTRLLVLPVGLASMLVWTTVAMSAGPLHSVAWLAVAVPAAAGWGLTWQRARADLTGFGTAARWAGGGALLAFAAYAAPVVLSGQATFTGYSMILDTAHHFSVAEWLKDQGTDATFPITSSYSQVASGLVSGAYPIGFTALLGAMSQLLGSEIAWMYHPTVAFVGPMAALAAFSLLRSYGLPPALGAAGAAICAQPSLLYAYGLQAGFKELVGMTMIVLVAALLAEPAPQRWRTYGVAGLAAAAAFVVFNLTIGPWLIVLAAVVALGLALDWARAGPDRRPLSLSWRWLAAFIAALCLAGYVGWRIAYTQPVGTWLTALGVVLVAGLALELRRARSARPRRASWRRPVLWLATFPVGLFAGWRIALFEIPPVVTAQSEVGNLADYLPRWSSYGVWITGDYRFALTDNVTLTRVLAAVVIALALLGVARLVARRHYPGLGLAVAVPAILLLLVPQTSPWIDAKAFAVNGGLVLVTAFAGIAVLYASRLRAAAYVATAVVGVAVLWGNVLAYHHTTLAPADRLNALREINERFAGQGPALAPSFDEYAEYFLRDIDATGRVDPLNGVFPAGDLFGADVSRIDPAFMQQARLLVLRRGADRTRPPSYFTRVYRDRFYDVWRRDGDPATVAAHIALNDRSDAGCRSAGETLRAAAGTAGLLWATAPDPVVVESILRQRPSEWLADPDEGWMRTRGRGRIDADPYVSTSGRYEVWVEGSFQRPAKVVIDGRTVGELAYSADYPQEQQYVTTIELAAGSHQLSFVRSGGSLRPGNGDATGNRLLGAMYLRREDEADARMFRSPVGRFDAICRSDRPLAWVEALASPGSAS